MSCCHSPPKNMKEMLYSAIESIDQLPNDTQDANGIKGTNDTNDSIDDVNNDVNQSLKQFEEQFFSYCEQELSKINTFFAEKLAEAIRKFGDLKAELMASQHLKKQNGINYYNLFCNFSSNKFLIDSILSLFLNESNVSIQFTGIIIILNSNS